MINYLLQFIFFFHATVSIYGQIPDSIYKASKLQVLELSSNKFEGTIPTCLTKIETLGVLILRENKLTFSIPDTFPLPCSLRTLDVKQNQLHGKLSESLANCLALEHIHIPCTVLVRQNGFHGPIECAKTKGIWKMLQIVDLALNNFSGMLPVGMFRTWEKMMPDEKATAERVRFKRLVDLMVYIIRMPYL